MTALTYVTAKEMKKRTGLSTALGYTFPEEDEILIRKGLDPELKKKVLAHEEEHIEKGEEGPFWDVVIGGALGLLGASKSSKAAKSAAGTAAAGSERELEFARESRDLARADQAPYREAGTTALSALMSLTGLGGGTGGAAAPSGQSFVGTDPYNDPGPRPGRGVRHPSSGVDGRWASNYNLRYAGGPTEQGQMYNINELGPENVYSGGALSRNPNPMTISGQSGYVQPNIQGRVAGGFMEDTHYAGPPPGKPAPPWIPGGQGGNQANTTAINPQTGFPNENPGGVEGGYQFQTDPGYQFRFSEGQRALDRGAAAKGGLMSGGYGRKAIRYGQGFASNEFSNVYNRISNIAGLGQVSAGQSGQYAMYGGAQMGNAASQGANASAYGQIQSGNAWANAANQAAQLPWGDIFRPGQTQPTTNTWNPYTDNLTDGWRR